MSSLPPGWYRDPADTSTQRWWDGEGWLGEPLPAEATPPDGPPPKEPAPAPGPPPAGGGTDPAAAGTGNTPALGGPGSFPAPGGPGSFPTTGGPGAAPAPGWPPDQAGPAPYHPNQAGAPPGQAGAPQGWPPNQAGAPQGWPPNQAGAPQGWPPNQAGAPQGWPPQQAGAPQGWGPPGAPGTFAPPYPVQARPHGFALAGLGSRLVARLLDILAVFVLNAVVNGYFVYQFAREFAPYWQAAMDQAVAGDAFTGDQPQPTSRLQYLLWAILIIATLLWLLYEAPSLANRGQTLGKRIMHIRVMAVEDTGPLGFGRAFRRWARLGLWTPLWGCAGLGLLLQLIDSASPLFDQRLRQALHDKTARTVVVEYPPGARKTVDATPGSSEGSP